MAIEIDTNVVDNILPNASSECQDDFAPKWLSSEFVESHLQNRFNNKQLRIIGFDIKPATASGENYASCIYRVKVTFTDNARRPSNNNEDFNVTSLNVIVKTAVTGEFALETLCANNIYNKEIEFYTNIAPKINQELAKLNDDSQLIAMPYGVCNSNSAILFEDLSTKEYGISSVCRGFNFDEATFVLKKAATFHAINAVLQENQPDIFQQFEHGLMSRHTNALDTFYLTQLDVLMEVVLPMWPDADYYIPKLRRVRNNLMKNGAKAFDANPDHFNTLIHGDMWVNNLMLKYKHGVDSNAAADAKIENAVLIDFQYSCWTSPAIDLHYFFNNSLQESLRHCRFDELIAIYHDNLEATLKQLAYKQSIPTLEQFKQQYVDKNFYGFVVSCLVQPLMINENTEGADVEALIMGDERAMKYKRIIYSSSKVQDNLRKLIPYYDKIGLFD